MTSNKLFGNHAINLMYFSTIFPVARRQNSSTYMGHLAIMLLLYCYGPFWST